jgi:hypothetical protein
MRPKFHSYEFDIQAFLKAVFIIFLKKKLFFTKNQYAEDGFHQISYNINLKFWRNVKLFNQIII